jgi:hypothetical protein
MASFDRNKIGRVAAGAGLCVIAILVSPQVAAAPPNECVQGKGEVCAPVAPLTDMAGIPMALPGPVPAAPVIPAAPVVPAAPVIPAAPVLPAAPVIPAAPVVPAAPLVPAAGPLAPVAPLIPYAGKGDPVSPPPAGAPIPGQPVKPGPSAAGAS